jgi:macrolide-specific efflux system membrane fusion protein
MYRIHKYLACITTIFTITACSHPVETMPERKDIIDAVFASGNVASTNEYTVTAYTDGYLQSSFVAEGDTVKTGSRLFTLSNDVQQSQVQNASANYAYALQKQADGAPQIQQINIQIAQAVEQCKTDSINYARYQRLIKTNAVARADFEKVQLQYQNSAANVKSLEKSLADLKLTLSQNTENQRSQLTIQKQNNQYYSLQAAANGTVLTVYKKNGDLVRKGDALAKVGAGNLLAKLFIAEDDIQRVKPGMQLLISLNTDKNKLYKATISKIYPSFDEQQQSFIAEALFTEMPTSLKNNTQLQANIIVGEKKGALVIPTVYLDKSDNVTLKNGKQKVKVQVGIRNLDWTEITGGLSGHETIILPKN